MLIYIMQNYEQKYLKYKRKYLELKNKINLEEKLSSNQSGGSNI